MSYLKNNSLTTIEVSSGVTTITIKRRKSKTMLTRLGDVLNCLPNGLIKKDETGMGATYLEFTSSRNSIIVEPIKVTASAKAKHHNALYVGTPTELHPKKITDAVISEYITNNSDKFKKIVVVADSLPRLIKALGETAYNDYFLLVDEVDSFQTDAGFRGRMENCLDIYKMFPPERRALVSATVLSFSDPVLKEEPITVIRYDEPYRRTIDLFFTNQTKIVAVNMAQAKLEQYPDDKLMIAFNSVSGCRTIAEELLSRGLVKKEDIKVLCSINSKEEVRDYYTELTSDVLPGKVNFFTSAYFSGFDLNERYHLISISSNTNVIHALSDRRLKQIAGRCRDKHGLLSETIIHDDVPLHTLRKAQKFTEEDLIKAAKKELDAIKCVEHNYSSNPLLKTNLETIRDLMVKYTQREGHQFVRKSINPNEGYVVSYLNVDAYIENVRVRDELYTYVTALRNKLREDGHQVNFKKEEGHTELVEKGVSKAIRASLVQEAIQHIKERPKELESLLKSPNSAPIQKAIIRAFLDHREYIDNTQLLKHFEATNKHRDSRRFNNFLWSAFYESLDDGQLFKRLVRHHLPLNESFYRGALLERWNQILAESGMHETISSQTRAVWITNVHFKTVKDRKTKRFRIVSENPFKLTVLKKRIAFRNEYEVTSFYRTALS